MIKAIIAWFRNFSLYRVKTAIVITAIPALTFDFNVKTDLINRTFEWLSGSVSNVVVISIVLMCLAIIYMDLRLEKIKSNERIATDILKTIRDTKVSESLKIEMREFLKKDF